MPQYITGSLASRIAEGILGIQPFPLWPSYGSSLANPAACHHRAIRTDPRRTSRYPSQAVTMGVIPNTSLLRTPRRSATSKSSLATQSRIPLACRLPSPMK